MDVNAISDEDGGIWLSGNSSCKHFFTLPEDPVMVWKIKPQRTQRDTESCYFSLSPPLCSLCPLWFSETLFLKYQKVSETLVTATQDTREPGIFATTCCKTVTIGKQPVSFFENFKHTRSFVPTYPDEAFMQEVLAQITDEKYLQIKMRGGINEHFTVN